MMMFSFFYKNYRLIFLYTLANLFLPPTIIALVITRFILPYRFTESILLRVIWGIATCLGYWTFSFQYTLFKHSREAARLGGVLPPRMKGKWLGNADIVLRFYHHPSPSFEEELTHSPSSVKTIKEGYAVEHFQQYLDEYDCDTLNLGLWWQDTYVTRNHHIVQAMLATNFDNFRKGYANTTRFVCRHIPRLGPILTYFRLDGLFGEGIFGTDWPTGKAHRAMTRPFFGG